MQRDRKGEDGGQWQMCIGDGCVCGRACVCVCARACACVRARACARVCMRACLFAHAYGSVSVPVSDVSLCVSVCLCATARAPSASLRAAVCLCVSLCAPARPVRVSGRRVPCVRARVQRSRLARTRAWEPRVRSVRGQPLPESARAHTHAHAHTHTHLAPIHISEPPTPA